MISIFKSKLHALLNLVHIKYFGHSMGHKMKNFIENIGWVGASSIISIVLIFIVNILAGRILGPEEYGKYSLIISLGQMFIIPMLIGLNTASVKYISSSKTQKYKYLYSINSLLLSFISTTTIIIIFYLFKTNFSSYLKISQPIYLTTLIYSGILSIKYIIEANTKGFLQFKFLSLLETVNSITIFSAFFIFIFIFKNHTHISYIIPVITGLFLYIAIFFSKNRSIFKQRKLDKNIIKKLIGYGKFVIIGSIGGIAINNIDKFIINRFLSLSEVGLYSVYLSSSSFIGGYILQIFIQVFFPTASSVSDKKPVVTKIVKLMTITAIPIVIINIISTSFILYLVGNQYDKNIVYILLFSILGMLTIFSNIFWWLIASYGKSGIKFTSIAGITIGLFNLILMIQLVQHLKTIGVILALIITNLIIIFSSILYIKNNGYKQFK